VTLEAQAIHNFSQIRILMILMLPQQKVIRGFSVVSADEIIKKFNLKRLPEEGGFYAETYRSSEKIPKTALPSRYDNDKSFGTAIYYLLTPDTCSALHRLPTDEIFHFYLGDPVIMLQLLPDGRSKKVTMGHDVEAGQQLQVIVPRGVWQGSFLKEGGNFALLGTTMAPGFDFSDYETSDRKNLIERYSEHKELIIELTAQHARDSEVALAFTLTEWPMNRCDLA